MSALTSLEELIATYLSLLDDLATFLLTFALVYAVGRFVVVPLFDYRGTDRTLRAGLERLVSFGVIGGGVVLGLSLAGLDFVFERAAILVAAFTVVRVLADAAVEQPDVLERPEPAVRITELGETVEVVTSLWIGNPDPAAVGRIRSEYAREIVARLSDAGVDLGSTTPRALEDEIGVGPESAEPTGRRRIPDRGPNRRTSNPGRSAGDFCSSSPSANVTWSTRWYTRTTFR